MLRNYPLFFFKIQISTSAVDYGFELQWGKTKDYKIGICCFFAIHAALRRKSKDWLTRNQDNVSEWGDMSICRLLFQWVSTKKCNKACWSSIKCTSSSSHLRLTFSRHDMAENCWVGIKQQSLTHSSIREATPMKKVFKKNHIILESNQDAPMVYCSTYLILKIRISLWFVCFLFQMDGDRDLDEIFYNISQILDFAFFGRKVG